MVAGILLNNALSRFLGLRWTRIFSVTFSGLIV